MKAEKPFYKSFNICTNHNCLHVRIVRIINSNKTNVNKSCSIIMVSVKQSLQT